ncbi:hypothetical protein E2C01_082835 [Portunus trituberculatus]|uniref:Uncharacterized protein n=1 Tax=Portunus trituberculatus TaxID=210409 RepID=A0A5B7IQY3_PORTR|nr:hypothetical protein [Portunus trituberculatus]
MVPTVFFYFSLLLHPSSSTVCFLSSSFLLLPHLILRNYFPSSFLPFFLPSFFSKLSIIIFYQEQPSFLPFFFPSFTIIYYTLSFSPTPQTLTPMSPLPLLHSLLAPPPPSYPLLPSLTTYLLHHSYYYFPPIPLVVAIPFTRRCASQPALPRHFHKLAQLGQCFQVSTIFREAARTASRRLIALHAEISKSPELRDTRIFQQASQPASLQSSQPSLLTSRRSLSSLPVAFPACLQSTATSMQDVVSNLQCSFKFTCDSCFAAGEREGRERGWKQGVIE